MIAVGQDGLVANVAKYLDGQPVIGINPEPARNPGVLVPARTGRDHRTCSPYGRSSSTNDGRRRPPTTASAARAQRDVRRPPHPPVRALPAGIAEGRRNGSRPRASWSAPAPAPPAGAAQPGRNAAAPSPCRARSTRSCAGSSARPGPPRPPAPTYTEGFLTAPDHVDHHRRVRPGRLRRRHGIRHPDPHLGPTARDRRRPHQTAPGRLSYSQTVARSANSAGSLCTGITHSRCPPGARSVWQPCQLDTSTAPSPVSRATSAGTSSVSISR